MPAIRVVTDSACDLPDDLLSEHGIGLVPLRIRFGDKEYVDRHELPTDQFWMEARGFHGLPQTAAPSPGQFQAEFERMADEGAEGVVCISLSSKVSATIQSARQAATDLGDRLPVRVVDSLSVTLGLGLQVLEAAEAAESGKGMDQVVDAVVAAQSRLSVYGALDTLENLRHGGRIGSAQALFGSMLSIKPVIEVRDGEVAQESKQRTRGRSLRYLADKVRAFGPLGRLAVFHADAADFDHFMDLLQGVKADRPTVVGDIGPVIGSHAGPGAVGVAMLAPAP
jgi:DegV family protein with EDD domain